MEAYFNKRGLKNLIISNDSSKLKGGACGSLYHYGDDYLIKAYIDFFKENHIKLLLNI